MINASEINFDEICHTFPEPKYYDTISNISLILFIIGNLHIFIGLIVFYILRKRYERLQSRSLFLIFVSTFGVYTQGVSSLLCQIVVVPCYIAYFCFISVVPFIGVSACVRLYDFLYKQIFARLVANFDINKLFIAETALATSINEGDMNIIRLSKPPTSIPSPPINDNLLKVEKIKVEAEENKGLLIPFPSAGIRSLRILKLCTSHKATAVFVIVILIPYFIISMYEITTIPYLNPSSNCSGCPYTPTANILITAGTGVFIFLFTFAIYHTRHFRDVHGKKQEINVGIVGASIGVSGYLLFIQYPNGVVSTSFSFDWITWFGVQIVQFSVVTLQIYISVRYEDHISLSRRRRRHRKKNRNTVGGSSITMAASEMESESTIAERFKACMTDPAQHSEFEEYLIYEFAVENLKMYDECDKWKNEYFDSTPLTRRVRAKRIVQLFVESNSVFFVNLPATIRNDLSKRVNDPSNDLSVDFFAQAQREMYEILFGVYPRFENKKPKTSIVAGSISP